MSASRRRFALLVLDKAPLLLLAGIFIVFGIRTPVFLDPENLVHILIQSSSTAILACGMTFVLLTGGIDLSVGAILFLTAGIAGKLLLAGFPLPATLLVLLAAGVLFGAVNAFFIVKLGVASFIVTLATFHLGRGLGLWLTETRAMNLPASIVELGTGSTLGIPHSILVLAAVLGAAHVLLTRTPFGRQVLAVGHDLGTAKKAGLRTGRLLASVYMLSGLSAVIAGMISLGQLGAVSPTFGVRRELDAIAAAVIGGTSLFGGRGNILPGALLGAVLIGSIENGLVLSKTNPYVYPLVTAGIIFLAALVDSLRSRQILKLGRRRIRAP